MANDLGLLYDQLKNIESNLKKVSYPKRTETVLKQKLHEATLLKCQFDECIQTISIQIENKQFSTKVLQEIQSHCDLFEKTFNQIETFCSKTYSSQPSAECTVEAGTEVDNMEAFNYRTAVALLPVMNGDENVTKSLIDAIELYSSSLTEEGNKMLVKFVLKTRLNENAKLRLSVSYDSCESLIIEMRQHLLTKKSSTAIHKELTQINQNGTTIEKYGSRVEQLFVDLTVAQAGEDQTAYKILRPQNEKIAIKSFIDGLRNREIRTILAARNYDTLKDTIRAAKDEDLSCSRQSSAASVYVGYQGSFKYRGFSFSNNRRPNHSNPSPPPVRVFIQRGNSRGFFQNYSQHQNQRNQQQFSNSRGRMRGSYRGRPGRIFTRRGNVHAIENGMNSIDLSDGNRTPQPTERRTAEPLQFFR